MTIGGEEGWTMNQRHTKNFSTVELQGYTESQIAFISIIEGDYQGQPLARLVTDYTEELARLA